MRNDRANPGKIKDVFLYILIGALVVLAIALFELHQVRSHGSPDLPIKWMGFGGMSAIVFGYAIRSNRANWRKSRFWGLLAAFSLVHFVLALTVIPQVATVPLVLYAVLTGMEYFVLSTYLAFFLDRAGGPDINR